MWAVSKSRRKSAVSSCKKPHPDILLMVKNIKLKLPIEPQWLIGRQNNNKSWALWTIFHNGSPSFYLSCSFVFLVLIYFLIAYLSCSMFFLFPLSYSLIFLVPLFFPFPCCLDCVFRCLHSSFSAVSLGFHFFSEVFPVTLSYLFYVSLFQCLPFLCCLVFRVQLSS